MKSRKGISPILATLLLIVIAVAAIAVTYAWIMTYMGSTTTQAGVQLYKANVGFTSDLKTVTIDVGNSGTADATLAKIYIGTSEASLVDIGELKNTSVPKSSVVSNTYTPTVAFTTKTTYYFKVVPSTGSPLSFSEKSP